MTKSQHWQQHTNYPLGHITEYNNVFYKCLQHHNSQDSLYPDSYNGLLWTDLPHIVNNNYSSLPWFSGMYYYQNTIVVFDNRAYICLQPHIANPFSSPAHSQHYWQPIA